MGKQLVALGLLLFLVSACSDHDPPVVEPPPLGPCKPTGRTLTFEGVEFVEIGPGWFLMGSEKEDHAKPVHRVKFRHGFWIARTEITNAQHERFRPKNERSEYSKGDDTPVVDVSWEDAKSYCAWLAEKSGRPIRLPSEAEWECACRAGSEDEFTFGDDEEKLSEYAWYGENSEGRAHAVGTKRPNRWGLFDLHGNVWEWCEDTYHQSYEDAPTDGSAWTEGGVEWEPGTPGRVNRGGSWDFPAEDCRSAGRDWYDPAVRHWALGFRPAFVPSED